MRNRPLFYFGTLVYFERSRSKKIMKSKWQGYNYFLLFESKLDCGNIEAEFSKLCSNVNWFLGILLSSKWALNIKPGLFIDMIAQQRYIIRADTEKCGFQVKSLPSHLPSSDYPFAIFNNFDRSTDNYFSDLFIIKVSQIFVIHFILLWSQFDSFPFLLWSHLWIKTRGSYHFLPFLFFSTN